MKDRNVGRDDGNPGRNRRHDRGPYPSAKEGIKSARAPSSSRFRLGVGSPETRMTGTLQRRTSVEQIDDVLILPSPFADQKELGRRIAELARRDRARCGARADGSCGVRSSRT